jgi:hypothetical protein
MTDPIRVKVIVPSDLTSVVVGPSGETYVAKTADIGETFMMMSEEDARIMINGAYSDQRWKAANPTLSAVLGRPPKPEAGINLAALQMAHYQATRPTTILEDAARLRSAALGGWRR